MPRNRDRTELTQGEPEEHADGGHPTFLDAECDSVPTPVRARSSCFGRAVVWSVTPTPLVIPLLVPDAPVVAWWPNEAPANLSKDLLGSMASSRITDAMHSSNPRRTMDDLRRNWSVEERGHVVDASDRMACDDCLDARPAAAPAGKQCASDRPEGLSCRWICWPHGYDCV